MIYIKDNRVNKDEFQNIKILFPILNLSKLKVILYHVSRKTRARERQEKSMRKNIFLSLSKLADKNPKVQLENFTNTQIMK